MDACLYFVEGLLLFFPFYERSGVGERWNRRLSSKPSQDRLSKKMKQSGEDVEATAQLMSKEEDHAVSNDSFDFSYDEEVNDAYSSYWASQYRSTSRHLWLRMQSLPLPSWLPIRKLNQLNPRYIVFVFAVSLVITVLIVNPYGPYGSTQTSPTPIPTQVSLSPTTTQISPTPTKTKAPGLTAIFGSSSAKPLGEFCTTWPVDKDGNYDLSAHDRSSQVEPYSIAPQGGWKKPEGVKIVAMVFFGRKRYVDILDCYLQQNLASNGGYLDEVWFMMHTKEKEDIEWLKRLVINNQDYKIIGQEDCSANNFKYGCLWKFATEDNTIYIKLDDDIVSYP